jgi:hypothetical protein
MTRLRTGRQGFNSRQVLEREFFYSPLPCSDRLWASYPLGSGGGGAVSMGIKRPGHETDYSPSPHLLPNLMCGVIPPLPRVFMAWYLIKHRISLHGMVVKHRDNI